MNTEKENIILVIGILYILISFIYIFGASYTGYVVFEENYISLDFSNSSEYIYDNNTIEFSNSISLIPNIETTTITEETLRNSYVTLAYKDEHDITSKIIALDNNTVNIEKEQNENIFNVFFDKNLTDNDLIRFYIYRVGEVTADKIFLCDINQTCLPPGYGEVDVNDEGWYNITITNLNKETNSFNVDPEKIKFDYVDALSKEINSYNLTNITYPGIGIVETENIFINGTLGNFIPNATLNNQTINYYYSTDNGENWNIILDNLNNFNNIIIKFKIELISDTKQTPILYDIKVDFIQNINNSTNTTQPPESSPASGGSSGGGGGSSGGSGSSRSEPTLEPTIQTTSVLTPLEELPSSKNIIQPKIIKKLSINPLTELAGRTTYSRTNMVKFLKSNLWILIILIILIIIYLVLHQERHKIHKFYKSKK